MVSWKAPETPTIAEKRHEARRSDEFIRKRRRRESTMKYDFDSIINRYGTNSMKYDYIDENGKPEGVLPMWVADMDFSAPPEVLEDIKKAISHGVFGYSEPKDEYYTSVANWFSTRFNYHVTQLEIVKTPGVVFALAQCVRAYTEHEDAILVQTPVYYPFYSVISNNGRRVVTNPLVYENGSYRIDLDDFERKIVEYDVKMFILCNPHNPVGRVWTRAELESMNEICVNRDVIVVSDEIYCDLVWTGNTHICFATLNENAIIATAPSKSFNLAGLQTSNIFVKNAEMREKLKSEISRSGHDRLNMLGLVACQSAYTKGAAWLEELRLYITDSIRYAGEFFASELPVVKMVKPESTYLLWLDFSALELDQEELDHRISEGAKIWMNNGTMFGEDGKGFQRLNIACPRSILVEALDRLQKEFA